MFWTEKSNGQSVIKQAPMDGSSDEEFARYTEDKMKSPTDIVIDMTGKLFLHRLDFDTMI